MFTPSSRPLIVRTPIERRPNLWKQPGKFLQRMPECTHPQIGIEDQGASSTILLFMLRRTKSWPEKSDVNRVMGLSKLGVHMGQISAAL